MRSLVLESPYNHNSLQTTTEEDICNLLLMESRYLPYMSTYHLIEEFPPTQNRLI